MEFASNSPVLTRSTRWMKDFVPASEVEQFSYIYWKKSASLSGKTVYYMFSHSLSQYMKMRENDCHVCKRTVKVLSPRQVLFNVLAASAASSQLKKLIKA